MKILLRSVLLNLAMSCAIVATLHCSSTPSPAAKTAEAVAVVVADATCQVLEAQSTAEWVQLLCAAEGAATKVLVKLPRAQWSAIRAARVDAGPGK